MKKKIIFLFIVMALISFISAAGTKLFSEGEVKQQGKITIVTSFYPVYIAAKNVADEADNVEVINMTENHTGCLHDYQLTTNDMRKLENAQLFIMNGGGIEPFVEDIIRAYPKLDVIDTSIGADFIEDEEQNSHIWLSLENYKIQIENIRDGLIKYDKSNAKKYEENAEEYLKQANRLMEEEEILKEKIKNKNIIVLHEGFEYLAKELGLNIVYKMDLDEEVSLSAGQVAEMIEKIRQYNISAVFVEEEQKDFISKSIKSETDTRVYGLNALVSGEYNKDSYLSDMSYNINVIKEALK